jgi:uncharacterized membrane protein
MRYRSPAPTAINVLVIISTALYTGTMLGTQRALPPHVHRILSMALGTACMGVLAKSVQSIDKKNTHVAILFAVALVFMVVRVGLWNTVDASKTAMVRIDRAVYTVLFVVVLMETSVFLFPGTPMHVVVLAAMLVTLYPIAESLMTMLFWNERSDTYTTHLAAASSYEAYGVKSTIANKETGTKCGVTTHVHTNTVVVFFAGTDDVQDMKHNASIGDVQWTCRDGQRYGRVHRGFVNAYMSVREQLHNAIAAAMSSLDHHPTIIVTGHSLGGALAILAAADLTCQTDDNTLRTRMKVVTFGAPPLCDDTFVKSYANNGPAITWRIVNPWDYVPRLPGVQFVHVGKKIIVTSPNPLENTPTPLAHSMTTYRRAMSKSRGQHMLGLVSPVVYIVIAILAVHLFKAALKSS